MYLGLGRPTSYHDPWQIRIEARKKWLFGADLRLVYIYEKEDTSTFRYRVFNMIEAIRSITDRKFAASWFTRTEYATDPTIADLADVLIIVRTRYDYHLARLIERARARDALILFDIDDLVFDLRFAHFIIDTLDVDVANQASWDYWYAYLGRLHASLVLCDGAIATTDFLASQIARSAGSLHCAVIPNFLNSQQIRESQLLKFRKEVFGFRRDENVTIGYFSGTPSHNRDLLIASPALATLMNRHAGLTLRIVGFIDLNEHLLPYRDRIELLPLQDYLNLQRVIAECEFSIAPLQENTFTNCKSELKYFEPAIVGCPVVATPIPSFQSCIVDGVNGQLSKAYEWEEKIEDLYLAARNGEPSFARLASAAADDAGNRYHPASMADAIIEAIASLAKGAGKTSLVRILEGEA